MEKIFLKYKREIIGLSIVIVIIMAILSFISYSNNNSYFLPTLEQKITSIIATIAAIMTDPINIIIGVVILYFVQMKLSNKNRTKEQEPNLSEKHE